MKKKIIKALSPNKFFDKLIRWLGTGILKCTSKELSYGLWITDKILTVLKTRGKHEAIKYCKGLRLRFLDLILSMDEGFNLRVPKSVPKVLRPIKKYIEGNINYPFIRLINSCLYVTRFIRLEPVPNHSTIEARPGYTGDPRHLRVEMEQFLKDLGINTKMGLGKVPKALRFSHFHMTSKKGPNGHALWTSFDDALSLSSDMLESIRVVGGDRLHNLISRFMSLYLVLPAFFDRFRTLTGARIPRRIACIQDKEGKTREVAIGDYYTQAALLPLHNFLFKHLRRITQDCTFNQTKLFRSLWADKGSSFHSVDLTAATDRFPIAIQKELLDVWFGSEYATH